MRTPSLALILTCSLAFAATANPRHSLEDRGLEHHLPASTLAYLECHDMAAMKAAFHELGLVRLMRDPGMQAFVEPGLQFARQMIEQEGQRTRWVQMALGILQGLDLVEGQIAFALLDVTIPEGGMRPAGVPFTVAAAIDFGANRERFQNGAHQFLNDYGIPHELADMAEHQVIVFQLEGMPVYATFAGTRLVLTNEKEALEQILLGAHREGSLAGTASFQKVRREVLPGGAGLFAYASVETLMQRFQEQMDASMGAAEGMLLSFLGLDAIGGIGYGMRFEGRDVVERFHLESRSETNAILDWIAATQPAKHSVASWIPADAWWYSSAGLDLVSYYDTIVNVLSQMEGPEEVGRQIEEFETQVLGFQIRDALACFAPEISFAMHSPAGGGLLPEITLFMGVADPARLADVSAQALEVLSGALGEEEGVSLSAKAHEYQGMTYHTLDVSFPYGDDPFPLRPAMMIHDGQLVLTLAPLHMKNVIDRIHAGGASPSIADSGPIKEAWALAPQGHVQFDYMDLTSLASVLWNTGIPIAQAVLHGKMLEEVPFELELAHLPTARVIREHVGPLVGWTEREGSSVTMSLRSPCGIVSTIGLIAAVAIPVTVRQVEAAEARAREFEREMEDYRKEQEEQMRRLEEGRRRDG